VEAKMYNQQWWISETDPYKIISYFENLLKESGFNILKKTEHHFEPYGYTGLWLLSESHFAVHSFPEENKSYIELSSCVKEYYDEFLRKIDNNLLVL
jgi:S-adenosylmethionine decarboxylase